MRNLVIAIAFVIAGCASPPAHLTSVTEKMNFYLADVEYTVDEVRLSISNMVDMGSIDVESAASFDRILRSADRIIKDARSHIKIGQFDDLATSLDSGAAQLIELKRYLTNEDHRMIADVAIAAMMIAASNVRKESKLDAEFGQR